MIKIDINDLDKYFQKGELIPAIAFDVDTKTVLMLAYMNRESLRKTLETGYTWYWSRSRQELWNKGATSGHYLHVRKIMTDCDADTVRRAAAGYRGERGIFLPGEQQPLSYR